MDEPKQGFTQHDPSQGPQQASGIQEGGLSLDSQSIGAGNTVTPTESVDGSAGSIPWGNAQEK
jgi:hypothetical protein